MNTFIEKNILLDEIMKHNEYITSYPDTQNTTYLVELIMELRESTNVKEDLNIFELILQTMDHIIDDTTEYISIIETSNIEDIEFLHQIIYELNNSIIKINNFINYINSIDCMADMFETITL